MSKSIYSLVLTDEVISEIDRLAYRKGMSRSALIDSLLAKEISYMTPEMRIKQIINEFQSGLPVDIFMPNMIGNSSISVRSALAYKYNPSLRYSVELVREYGEDGYIGTLSIWLRSRSEALNELLKRFFEIWAKAEININDRAVFRIDKEKVYRELRLANPTINEISCEEIGGFLSEYVKSINRSIETFFSTSDPELCVKVMNNELIKLYENGGLL